jgi:lysine-specific demethylase 8
VQINLDAPDYSAFPASENVPFRQCVLQPGETLFIPRLAWHYVRSLETSFSASFWWGARMALVKGEGGGWEAAY